MVQTNFPTNLPPRGLSATAQERHASAVRAAAAVSRDFPLLPTSDTDATPTVGEDSDDKLTPGQRLAVAAIVSGENFAAAARAAKVSRRTLYAWRQEPDFRQAVESRSREAMSVAMLRVRNLMLRATRVMGEAMLEGGRDGSLSAFRVLNSARLWRVATDGAETSSESPEDAALGN